MKTRNNNIDSILKKEIERNKQSYKEHLKKYDELTALKNATVSQLESKQVVIDNLEKTITENSKLVENLKCDLVSLNDTVKEQNIKISSMQEVIDELRTEKKQLLENESYLQDCKKNNIAHSEGWVSSGRRTRRGTHGNSVIPRNSDVKTNKKREGRGLHMSDEEGEVLTSTPRSPVNSVKRLSELQWRNSLYPPHLKSSYPAETHFEHSVHEEDFKNSELSESPRVEMSPHASRKTGALSRPRALFYSTRNDTLDNTPRRILSNIFKKK